MCGVGGGDVARELLGDTLRTEIDEIFESLSAEVELLYIKESGRVVCDVITNE